MDVHIYPMWRLHESARLCITACVLQYSYVHSGHFFGKTRVLFSGVTSVRVQIFSFSIERNFEKPLTFPRLCMSFSWNGSAKHVTWVSELLLVIWNLLWRRRNLAPNKRKHKVSRTSVWGLLEQAWRHDTKHKSMIREISKTRAVVMMITAASESSYDRGEGYLMGEARDGFPHTFWRKAQIALKLGSSVGFDASKGKLYSWQECGVLPISTGSRGPLYKDPRKAAQNVSKE